LKRSLVIGTGVLLLIFSFSILSGGFAQAQAASEAQPAATATTPSSSNTQPSSESAEAEKAAEGDADEESETDAFRHSPAVKAIAGIVHLPVDTTATIIQFINFGLLAAALLYFLVKVLPTAYRNRKTSIQKALVDARSATQIASERLNTVEQRLSRLDQEIDSIRKQVEQDALNDEARIKAALEEERVRIVDSAGHEIEAAGVAAQRNLKRFAAELALDRATSQLSLDQDTDRKLVSGFAQGLGNSKDGGRN
jgi:F-type H+-transporting ATPase subunit b